MADITVSGRVFQSFITLVRKLLLSSKVWLRNKFFLPLFSQLIISDKALSYFNSSSYIYYVVPFLCYGSAIWKSSKGDLGIIESVQRKAISWIFMTSNSHISYKDKLVKLNILPLSLYQELHVGLLFAKILAGKVDIDWRSHVSITDVGNRRAQMTQNFVCKQMCLKKCESDFWFRARRLANLYNEYFKCDILFDPECKNRLLGMYTKFSKLATTNQTNAHGAFYANATT